MLRRILYIVAQLGFVAILNGQNQTVPEQIQSTVDAFIDAMNNNDTIAIRKVIDPNIGLLTVFHDGKKNILAAETVDMLLNEIAKPKTQIYREEQGACSIETNGILATAWCKYVFYQENRILHCGINAYQLYKTKKGWKIIQITDSRQTINCNPLNTEKN